MGLDNYPILIRSPVHLPHIGAKMIEPPLTTLLPNATLNMRRNDRPILGPIFLHQLDQELVFFFLPRTFDQSRIKDLLPSVKALQMGTIVERLSDFFPITLAIHHDCACKCFILFQCPLCLGCTAMFILLESTIFVLAATLRRLGRRNINVTHGAARGALGYVLHFSLQILQARVTPTKDGSGGGGGGRRCRRRGQRRGGRM